MAVLKYEDSKFLNLNTRKTASEECDLVAYWTSWSSWIPLLLDLPGDQNVDYKQDMETSLTEGGDKGALTFSLPAYSSLPLQHILA